MLKAKTILIKCFNHWESTINGASNFNESKGRILALSLEEKKKNCEKQLIPFCRLIHKI